MYRGGLKKWISRWTMLLADSVITFSDFSKQEAIKNTTLREKQLQVIYLGVHDKFSHFSFHLERPLVLSIGKVDQSNLLRKGHEIFVRTAAYLPETSFVLIGNWADKAIDRLLLIATDNVIFTGWLDTEELLQYLQRASIYVQPSAHEGFGLSVAEAMLAGCIPVVTSHGSLPEVVGDCGFYVDDPSPRALAQTIKKAFLAPQSLRRQARERILHQFPIEKRARALKNMISNLSEAQVH